MNCILQCLIYYGQFTDWCSIQWNKMKVNLRTWLGPAPITYQLLPDGRVVPGTVQIPLSILHQTYLYTPDSTMLEVQTADASQLRSQRFPWIAVEIEEGSERIDLSDWVQSLRWKGSTIPSLGSLLTLWSFLSSRAVSSTCIIHTVKNSGDTEQFTWGDLYGLCR